MGTKAQTITIPIKAAGISQMEKQIDNLAKKFKGVSLSEEDLKRIESMQQELDQIKETMNDLEIGNVKTDQFEKAMQLIDENFSAITNDINLMKSSITELGQNTGIDSVISQMEQLSSTVNGARLSIHNMYDEIIASNEALKKQGPVKREDIAPPKGEMSEWRKKAEKEWLARNTRSKEKIEEDAAREARSHDNYADIRFTELSRAGDIEGLKAYKKELKQTQKELKKKNEAEEQLRKEAENTEEPVKTEIKQTNQRTTATNKLNESIKTTNEELEKERKELEDIKKAYEEVYDAKKKVLTISDYELEDKDGDLALAKNFEASRKRREDAEERVLKSALDDLNEAITDYDELFSKKVSGKAEIAKRQAQLLDQAKYIESIMNVTSSFSNRFELLEGFPIDKVNVIINNIDTLQDAVVSGSNNIIEAEQALEQGDIETAKSIKKKIAVNKKLIEYKTEVEDEGKEPVTEDGQVIDKIQKIRLRVTNKEVKKLIERVDKIIDNLNENVDPLKIPVAFVSKVKKDQVEEIVQQMLDKGIMNLDGKTDEEVKALVEGLRKDLNKALKSRDAKLEIKDNVDELKNRLREGIKDITSIVGGPDIYANIKIDREKVEAELKKLKKFKLEIDDIKFGKGILQSLTTAEELLEKQKQTGEEITEENEKAVIEKAEKETKKIEKLVQDAFKVTELIKKLNELVGVIPLSVDVKFNEKQIKADLEAIEGLAVKVSKLIFDGATPLVVSKVEVDENLETPEAKEKKEQTRKINETTDRIKNNPNAIQTTISDKKRKQLEKDSKKQLEASEKIKNNPNANKSSNLNFVVTGDTKTGIVFKTDGKDTNTDNVNIKDNGSIDVNKSDSININEDETINIGTNEVINIETNEVINIGTNGTININGGTITGGTISGGTFTGGTFTGTFEGNDNPPTSGPKTPSNNKPKESTKTSDKKDNKNIEKSVEKGAEKGSQKGSEKGTEKGAQKGTEEGSKKGTEEANKEDSKKTPEEKPEHIKQAEENYKNSSLRKRVDAIESDPNHHTTDEGIMKILRNKENQLQEELEPGFMAALIDAYKTEEVRKETDTFLSGMSELFKNIEMSNGEIVQTKENLEKVDEFLKEFIKQGGNTNPEFVRQELATLVKEGKASKNILSYAGGKSLLSFISRDYLHPEISAQDTGMLEDRLRDIMDTKRGFNVKESYKKIDWTKKGLSVRPENIENTINFIEDMVNYGVNQSRDYTSVGAIIKKISRRNNNIINALIKNAFPEYGDIREYYYTMPTDEFVENNFSNTSFSPRYKKTKNAIEREKARTAPVPITKISKETVVTPLEQVLDLLHRLDVTYSRLGMQTEQYLEDAKILEKMAGDEEHASAQEKADKIGKTKSPSQKKAKLNKFTNRLIQNPNYGKYKAAEKSRKILEDQIYNEILALSDPDFNSLINSTDFNSSTNGFRAFTNRKVSKEQLTADRKKIVDRQFKEKTEELERSFAELINVRDDGTDVNKLSEEENALRNETIAALEEQYNNAIENLVELIFKYKPDIKLKGKANESTFKSFAKEWGITSEVLDDVKESFKEEKENIKAQEFANKGGFTAEQMAGIAETLKTLLESGQDYESALATLLGEMEVAKAEAKIDVTKRLGHYQKRYYYNQPREIIKNEIKKDKLKMDVKKLTPEEKAQRKELYDKYNEEFLKPIRDTFDTVIKETPTLSKESIEFKSSDDQIAYFESKLDAIDQLFQKIDAYKDKYKEDTGKEKTIVELLNDAFGFGSNVESNRYSDINRFADYVSTYDEDLAKLEELKAKKDEKTKKVQEEVDTTNWLTLTDSQAKDINEIINKLKLNEEGSIAENKANKQIIKELMDKLTSIAYGKNKKKPKGIIPFDELERVINLNKIEEEYSSTADNRDTLRRTREAYEKEIWKANQKLLRMSDKDKDTEEYKDAAFKRDLYKDLLAKNDQQFSETISKRKDAYENFFESLKTFVLPKSEEVGQDIDKGEAEGLKKNAPKVNDAMADVQQGVIKTAKDEVDSHSPSVVFFHIGEDIIQGMLNGIKSGKKEAEAQIRQAVELMNKHLDEMAYDTKQGRFLGPNVNKLFENAVGLKETVDISKSYGINEEFLKKQLGENAYTDLNEIIFDVMVEGNRKGFEKADQKELIKVIEEIEDGIYEGYSPALEKLRALAGVVKKRKKKPVRPNAEEYSIEEIEELRKKEERELREASYKAKAKENYKQGNIKVEEIKNSPNFHTTDPELMKLILAGDYEGIKKLQANKTTKKRKTDNSEEIQAINQETKAWKEYNEEVALGLERLERIRKIKAFGITNSRDLYKFASMRQDLFDELTDEDFKYVKENPGVVSNYISNKVDKMFSDDALMKFREQLDEIAKIKSAGFGLNSESYWWTHFNTVDEKGNRTDNFNNGPIYKMYATFEDLANLNKDIVSKIMQELSAAGFKGQLKIPSFNNFDRAGSSDQLVIHGANVDMQKIAYEVLTKKFGNIFSFVSGGFDSMGKHHASFSQILSGQGEGFKIGTEETFKTVAELFRKETGKVDNVTINTNVANVDSDKTNVKGELPTATAGGGTPPIPPEEPWWIKQARENYKKDAPKVEAIKNDPNAHFTSKEIAGLYLAGDYKAVERIKAAQQRGKEAEKIINDIKNSPDLHTTDAKMVELLRAGDYEGAKAYKENQNKPEYIKQAEENYKKGKAKVDKIKNDTNRHTTSKEMMDLIRSGAFDKNKDLEDFINNEIDKKKNTEIWKRQAGNLKLVDKVAKAYEFSEFSKLEDGLEKFADVYELSEENRNTLRERVERLESLLNKNTNVVNNGGGGGNGAPPSFMGRYWYLNYANDKAARDKNYEDLVNEDIDTYLNEKVGADIGNLEGFRQFEKEYLDYLNFMLETADKDEKTFYKGWIKFTKENLAERRKVLEDEDAERRRISLTEAKGLEEREKTYKQKSKKTQELLDKEREQEAKENQAREKAAAKDYQDQMAQAEKTVRDEEAKKQKMLTALQGIIDKEDKKGNAYFTKSIRERAKGYIRVINNDELYNEREINGFIGYSKGGGASNPKWVTQDKGGLKKQQNELIKLLKNENLVGDDRIQVEELLKKIQDIFDATYGELSKEAYNKIIEEYEEITSKAKEAVKEQKELNKLVKDLNNIQEKRDPKSGELLYSPEDIEKAKAYAENISSFDKKEVEDFVKRTTSNFSETAGDRHVLQNLLISAEKLKQRDDVDKKTKLKIDSYIKDVEALSKQSFITKQSIYEISGAFKDLQREAEKSKGSFFKEIGTQLSHLNAKFLAQYMSLHDIIRYIRTAISTITELDTALTEMRKVSDETEESLKRYQKTTFDTASALGTTAVQIQQSTADWLRLGETLEEASKSAQAATILLNVSEFENINDATTALTAMSQAYKDLDKTEIIDVMNNIGNNYAIATDQLATALQSSAAALMTQGNDLYEAVALVTAGNQVVQDASKVGTGMRTIALRLSGSKLSKEEIQEELGELGEEVDDWVVQTEAKKRQIIMEYTKVASNAGEGVDILDSNGNLRDTYHILLDIAKVYKEIQEEDKKNGTNRAQALVEELAGKNRSQIAASILMNPDVLENVYESALNSAGSAEEENAKYLDSIVGKTNQIKNETQELMASLIDSDTIKQIIDYGIDILSIINQIGDKLPLIITLVGSLAASIVASKQGFKLFDFNKDTSAISLFGKFDLSEKSFKDLGKKISDAILPEGEINLLDPNFKIDGLSKLKDELSQLGDNFFRGFERNAIGVFDEGSLIKTLYDELKDTPDTIDDVIEKYEGLDEETKEILTNLSDQGIKTFKDYSDAEEAAGTSAKFAAVGVEILNTVIQTVAIAAISFIATKLVQYLTDLAYASENASKNMREYATSLKSIRNELKEDKEYIDDVKDEYEQLSKGIDNFGNNVSLTADEFKRYNEINKTLSEMFPEIIQGYDDERNAIVNLKSELKSLNDVYEEHNQLELSKAISDENFGTAAYNNYYELKKSNLLERGKSFFTGGKNAGEVADYDYLKELYETFLDMSYEEMQNVYNSPEYYQSVRETNFRKLMNENVISEDLLGLGSVGLGADFTEEDFRVARQNVVAELNKMDSEMNSALQSMRNDAQTYFEYALSIDDTNINENNKEAIQNIISAMDEELIDSFVENGEDYTEQMEKYVNYLIDNVANLDSDALGTILNATGDIEDKDIRETRDKLVGAFDQISKEINEKIANAESEEEKIYWRKIKNALWYDTGINDINQLELDFDKSLGRISGDNAGQLLRLQTFTKGFTKEQVELWLDVTSKTYNATDAMKAYNNAIKKAKETFRASDIEHLFSQDTIIDKAGFDDKLESLQKNYRKEIQEAKKLGAELDRTVYGNIDLDNRDVLEWNTENIEKYKDAIESWGNSVEDYAGTISTVDGMSEEFEGVEIAFSPMLQTPNGPVYLDSDTVHEYINTLLSKMPEGYTSEDLLKLDAKGLIVNGQKIKGLIAEIGDEAVRVGETMHYIGEDGSVNTMKKQIEGLKETYVTWGDVKNDLIGMAQSGRLDESSLKNYKYFDSLLKALGISAEAADEELKTLVDDINKIASNNVVDKFVNAKNNLDRLDNAYQTSKKKQPIDATTLNEIQDAFAFLGEPYREFENAVMTGETNLQGYFDELISQYIIQEGLLDNLTEDTKEWTEQQLVGYGLTKKSAEEMTSKAIENNKELQRNLLDTTQKLNNVVTLSDSTSNKIAKATNVDELDTKEISDLVTAVLAEGSGATEEEKIAAQDLALYTLQKALAGDKSLENEEDIEYLTDLINACGAGTEAVKQLAKAKQLANRIEIETQRYSDLVDSDAYKAMGEYARRQAASEIQRTIDFYSEQLDNIDYSEIGAKADKAVADAWKNKDPNKGLKGTYSGLAESNKSAAEEAYQKAKELIEKLLALYDAELAAGTITVQEYVEKSRRLIEEYYNDGKIKAADYYGYLESLAEKEKNQYDKVISAVQKLIQNQIKELEKQKEAIEENYNSQIEAIQEKIDAIQDENEEIDKNMALQKAQYNLNRALNQKTKLMYSESRGFYYTIDSKGVQDAEEELRKAQQDKLIYEYQKEIERLQEEMKKATEAIDEQIKKLNEYSEAWGEVASQLEDSMNAQIAAQILGQDWEQKILDQRLDTLQDFTDKYIELQKEQIKWALLRAEAEANGGSSSGGTSSSSVSGVTATSWNYNEGSFTTQQEALDKQEEDAQAEYDKYMYEHRGAPAWAIPKLEEEARKKKEEWKKNHPVTPAYFKGTSSAQRGESLVGEFGSEIVLHKNGTASIVDSPTLMDMEGGEKVFNAKETEDILKSKYKPLKNVNPKKFALLHSFANGTSSAMQNMVAAQAVSIASGLKNGLVPALATTGGNQTINQTFNVSLPNITDSSKAQDLFKEFEQLQRKATQFFN